MRSGFAGALSIACGLLMAKKPDPKRPADAVQRAIMIGKIATGEGPDPRKQPAPKPKPAQKRSPRS
jgi:hypothetical protein